MKKLMAIICVIVVLTGVLAATGIGVSATEDTYRVGYARVNITPYVVEGDPSSGVMALPLRGHGDVWNRPSVYVMDDNGDGQVDENDGLFVTCIAITDSADETILFYTIDVIGVGDYTAYRAAICERLGDSVEYNNIMLAGTHTHGAPDVSVYNSKGVSAGTVTVNGVTYDYQEMNTALGTWIDRTHKAAADAAEIAMNDRAPVTVKKGQISASQSEVADGRVMNSTRHYWNEAGGCVAGDNFNTRGNDPKQVGQVNDNMYILEFCYGEDSDKENVVLANWRGHPSLNSSSSDAKGRLTITSDYVNAFRAQIEAQGYRVAFFSGEGGNVNPRGNELDENGDPAYKWIDDFNVKSGDNNRGNGYGKVLGDMALECLAQYMTSVDSSGAIVARRTILNAERNLMGLSDLAYDASEYYLDNGETGRYVYTSSSGEKFVIASKHHANSVIGKWDRANSKPAATTRVGMELNTISIGKDIAFVTVPGEPFDRYSLEATRETANNYNDWANINGENLGKDFGTPFVLGYCNGTVGYIPSAMTYDYNADSDKWAWGSYETQTARVAQGTGEKMIQTFADMLMGEGDVYRENYCPQCQADVEWAPVSIEHNLAETMNGHYYLTEDVDGPQLLVKNGTKLCLDLNGFSYTGRTRAIYVYKDHQAAVMDTSEGKTGKMIGRGSTGANESGFAGATFITETDSELNIYGGTWTRIEGDAVAARNGGIGQINGVVNMYDGTITGGIAEADGGNLNITKTGVLNAYGGSITNGLDRNGNKNQYTDAHCICSVGKVQLSGDAVIDEIYVANTTSTTPKLANAIVIKDAYMGSVSLRFKSTVKAGTDIGDTDNAWLDSAEITVADKNLFAVESGTNLVLSADYQAALVAADGTVTTYNTLQNALEATATNPGTYARPLTDVDASAELRITQNAYLDLAGKEIAGSITVAAGRTLYCMDSCTDDYAVLNDGDGYGKLTGTVAGNVEGVPANSTVSPCESVTNSHRAGYLKVVYPSETSFHRVNLQITAMSLRANTVGVYYKCGFLGDEVVAENVESYGLALCVFDVPNAENLGVTSAYSEFTTFAPGAAGNAGNGTLLNNIMKSGYTAAVNASRAEMPVCGRAYIKTVDGEYVFGNYVERTLIQQVEDVDAIWGSLTVKQQGRMLDMYKTYQDVMNGWNIPNIQKAFADLPTE